MVFPHVPYLGSGHCSEYKLTVQMPWLHTCISTCTILDVHSCIPFTYVYYIQVHVHMYVWYECFTDNKPRKQVCARTCVSWACMSHGVQCLCVRGACCPSLLKQLVIWVVVEVSTGTVMCCCNSMCTGMYRVGMNVPLKTNRANKYAHVPLCRERACRTVCSVCAYGARVVHHLPSNS